MEDNKIDAIRFRYEVLGESLRDLAEESSIALCTLKDLCKAEHWEVKTSIPQMDYNIIAASPEDYADSLIKTAKCRLAALSVHKQLELRPKYMLLETLIVEKAINVTRSLSDYDTAEGQLGNASSKALKELTGVLKTLVDLNTLIYGGSTEEDDPLKAKGAGRVQVNIIQQFATDESSPGQVGLNIPSVIDVRAQ